MASRVAGSVVVVALVAALAGCGSGSEDASPGATVPKAVDASSAPTTTVAAAEPAGEDWDAVMRRILTRRDEAYEKNDISILEQIYDARCECLLRAREVIAQRTKEGVHTAGERLKLHSVEIFNRVSADHAFVRAIVSQGPNHLVAADGRVVRDGDTHGPTSVVYELGRRGQTWLIFGILPEGPA